MKNTLGYFTATFLLLLLGVPPAHPQGSLTPPGPPGPTMKRLDQVEPRTIVNAANTPGDATNSFIIGAPGSYYLTGNILSETGKNGIRITASDVTLDLNGFALIGAADTLHGIAVYDAQCNLAVRNGTVRGWQFSGVTAGSSSNCLFEQLRVSNNGSGGAFFGFGINAGTNCIVRDCAARENSADGFVIGVGGTITGCVAQRNASSGFAGADRSLFSHCNATGNFYRGFDCASFVTVVDCTASGSPEFGIRVADGCNVVRCIASQNADLGATVGIKTGDACTVSDCTSTSNDEGIRVGTGVTVRGCTVRANIFQGIYAAGDDCQLTGNTCSANFAGLYMPGNRGRVDGNSCTGNTNAAIIVSGTGTLVIRNNVDSLGYFIFPGNTLGPIVKMGGGGTITSTNPWANFVH